MKEDKVYVVLEESRTHGEDTEICCVGVAATREKAEEIVMNSKEGINKTWADIIDFDDDWEEEEDEPGLYTLARTSDYDYYYSVWIDEKPVLK